jgi:uncharacterized protein YbaA (DUF1428 family)
MRYADGYVLAIPKKHLGTYRRLAKKAAKIWREHGALEACECSGEDMKVKMVVPFTKVMKAKPSEAIIFSWIVFRSRAHRDKVNAKVMSDPRLAKMKPEDMPFDMKRMVYGGFDVIVDE